MQYVKELFSATQAKLLIIITFCDETQIKEQSAFVYFTLLKVRK